MIALLVRNLALVLFLAFLVVALLEQFNPTPPQMAIDFHRADFPVCATVHNAPLVPRRHNGVALYPHRSETA